MAGFVEIVVGVWDPVDVKSQRVFGKQLAASLIFSRTARQSVSSL